MRLFIPVSLATLLLCSACAPGASTQEKTVSCTDAWFAQTEQRINTSDGQGHGPDIGSDEWKSVVEFRLKMRGNPEVPDRQSDAWCDFIEQQLLR